MAEGRVGDNLIARSRWASNRKKKKLKSKNEKIKKRRKVKSEFCVNVRMSAFLVSLTHGKCRFYDRTELFCAGFTFGTHFVCLMLVTSIFSSVTLKISYLLQRLS